MLRTQLLGALAVMIAAAVVVPGSAAPASAAAAKHRLVVRDAVRVGTDGNGASTASFGGVAGSGVRSVLVVENGCRAGSGVGPCPAPVTTLSVTLNDEVVFQADSPFEDHRVRLPADAVSASQENRLTISAAGAPGSAARVRILARPPAPEHRLVVRDAVRVGTDGNGASTASFRGVAGSGVRSVLVVENGCRAGSGVGPCPAPVTTLSVTLNDEVVFQADGSFEDHRVRLPADAVSASQENRLTISAAGAPGSAARVRILARPPAPEHRLVVRDAVRVGTDGNGASTASFRGVAGSGVRSVLVVENGCRAGSGVGPCPAPVTTLSVTLNDEVVFQADGSFEDHRVRLPADAVSASQENRLTISAAGAPGSAARVRILALQETTQME